MSQALEYINHNGVDLEKLPAALKKAVEVLTRYRIDLAEENLYDEVSRTANAYRSLDIQTLRDLQVWVAGRREHPQIGQVVAPEPEPEPESHLAPEFEPEPEPAEIKFKILVNFLRQRQKTVKLKDLREAGYDVGELLANSSETIYQLRISKKGRLFPYYEISKAL